ncbi:MAG: hypothetical protein AAFN50_05435 [Pseudomonadota bacterium]
MFPMNYAKVFLAAMCLGVCCFAQAENEHSPSTAKEVVSRFFEFLTAGDTDSVDSLFYKIPAIESAEADWLALIEEVAGKVKDEQLGWETICAKELQETAVVIINQTMKHGKKHADPDAVYLVKQEGRWLLLPDIIAPNASGAVSLSLSNAQLGSRYSLEKWAVQEIRGITTECRELQAARKRSNGLSLLRRSRSRSTAASALPSIAAGQEADFGVSSTAATDPKRTVAPTAYSGQELSLRVRVAYRKGADSHQLRGRRRQQRAI